MWVVQGQKTGLYKWVGMGVAATVNIEPDGSNLKISIGGAKWAEQSAIAGAGGFFTGGITWITGAIGLAQQKQLMDTLWRLSEDFLVTRGGRRVK